MPAWVALVQEMLRYSSFFNSLMWTSPASVIFSPEMYSPRSSGMDRSMASEASSS